MSIIKSLKSLFTTSQSERIENTQKISSTKRHPIIPKQNTESFPNRPKASGTKPLVSGVGGESIVYEELKIHEKRRFNNLANILTLPNQHLKELSELMNNPAQTKLSGERAFELWLSAIIISAHYEFKELDFWISKFNEISYVPYMWKNQIFHITDDITKMNINTFKNKLSLLSTSSRAVVLAAGSLNRRKPILKDKIIKKCGISKKEFELILTELESNRLVSPSTIAEKLEILPLNELKIFAKHFNIKSTGQKKSIAENISRKATEDDLKKRFLKFPLDDVISLGPVVSELPKEAIETEKIKAEVILHYISMLSYRDKQVYDAKKSPLISGLIIKIADTDCPVCTYEAKRAKRLPPFFPGCRCGTLTHQRPPEDWKKPKGELKIIAP